MMDLNGAMLEKAPAVSAAIAISIPYCTGKVFETSNVISSSLFISLTESSSLTICTDVDTCARALNVRTSWSGEEENARCVEHPLWRWLELTPYCKQITRRLQQDESNDTLELRSLSLLSVKFK